MFAQAIYKALSATLLPLTLSLSFPALGATDLTIAVASNFAAPMKELAQNFERQTHTQVRLSIASTGKHFAHIVHGAPFDLFFAADSERPRELERNNKIVAGSRFTYAIGQLVLVSADPKRKTLTQSEIKTLQFHRLALANPKHAPYGKAANQVLSSLALWNSWRSKLIFAENVSQVFHYAISKNADLAFVARSHVRSTESSVRILWHVPLSLHQPIEQQAVQLTNKPIANKFVRFIKRSTTKELIRKYGYHVPS